MIKQKFIIANFLKKIGIHRKQKRILNVANELQLLREAEEILGRSVWTKVKDLEQYTIHYETIHKLLLKRTELDEKIQEIKEKMNAIKQSQETDFLKNNNSEHDINELYKKQQLIVDKIKSEQSDINDIANNIKRSFDGSVAKLERIMADGTDATIINAEKAKIKQLKLKYSELKDKKLLNDQKLADQATIIKKISDSRKSSKSSYKDDAIGNYQIMGKANRAISAYHSEIGLLDNKIISHYTEIGKNISKECFSNSGCRNAVKGKFNLCKIIKSLRQSIEYNHTLADR
jgi:hypothetical protein